MDFPLPLDNALIQRILPHRFPFLLVDRITEFVPDTRIVGIKNVSRNEKMLCREPGQVPTLPPTILTEAVAQVGAILILGKPENRDKLIFFMGIDHVRYRRPVYAGDQVEITALVKRLRTKMGWLYGAARVNGKVCAEGTMTFALGNKGEGGPQA
jgi:3-hydroxyacyl-[acyl-carrier-protein] dehydratase